MSLGDQDCQIVALGVGLVADDDHRKGPDALPVDVQAMPLGVLDDPIDDLLGRHRQDPRADLLEGQRRLERVRRKLAPVDYRLINETTERAVKQFNARVKGTEKFGGEEGAEAILQLRADHLSEDQPLEAFWQRRQASATGQRPYRRAG